MELKNNKSVWAALATVGITAIAAGATAAIKIHKKRTRQRQEANDEEEEAKERITPSGLSPEQEMVYNEAVRAFLLLNDRIYELRQLRKELQPLINWLATEGPRPVMKFDDERLTALADDIQQFLVSQAPFIDACINTICDDGTTLPDYLRAAVGKPFDPALDVEQDGAEVLEGSTIKYVLKLGYCFPMSRIATHPVKSIVLV